MGWVQNRQVSKALKTRDAAALRKIGEPAVDPLVGVLTETDSSVRGRAAWALGVVGGERAVQALAEALADEDVSVSIAASQALRWNGSERAVQVLAGALANKDRSVRRVAAGALAEIGGQRAVTPLIGVLADEDADVRRVAVGALVEVGEPVVEPLIGALADEDPDVRRVAVGALAKIGGERATQGLAKGGESAVKPLIQRLGWALFGWQNYERESDRRVMWAAIDALREISEPAVNPLVDALGEKDPSVRQGAALVLGYVGEERAVEPLIGALADDDESVRGAAAAALGAIGGERAVEALLGALADGDESVRLRAAEAFGKVGERAVDRLIGALADEDAHLRWAAARALGAIGGERAVEALFGALADEDAALRGAAAGGLGAIGERAVEPLIGALADEDVHVRLYAVNALGEIGDERAVKPLRDVIGGSGLVDVNVAHVDIAAKKALRRLGFSVSDREIIESELRRLSIQPEIGHDQEPVSLRDAASRMDRVVDLVVDLDEGVYIADDSHVYYSGDFSYPKDAGGTLQIKRCGENQYVVLGSWGISD